MPKTFAWPDVLDERNQALYEELAARIPIDLIPSGGDGWTSQIKEGRATVGYADTDHPHASATHELLHIKLELGGISSPFVRSADKDVTNVLVPWLFNELSHHRMFHEFVALGFPADEFLADSDVSEVQQRLTEDVGALERVVAQTPNGWLSIGFLLPYLCASSPHDASVETRRFRDRLRALVRPEVWKMCDQVVAAWADGTGLDIRIPIAQLLRLMGRPATELSRTAKATDLVSAQAPILHLALKGQETAPPAEEHLARVFGAEMLTVSKGALHCLPYCRALVHLFNMRNITARPLVVRCVVFNPQGAKHIESGLDIDVLCAQIVAGPYANGSIVQSTTDPTRKPLFHRNIHNEVSGRMVIPYRTIGFPASADDGARELGSYDSTTGGWLGHLVVVANETLIDMTIGQINADAYDINFAELYLTATITPGFLSGSAWLPVKRDGMLVCYQAYPDESTYLSSDSWRSNAKKKSAASDLQDRLRQLATTVAKHVDCREAR